jgi:invasion protein IalB
MRVSPEFRVSARIASVLAICVFTSGPVAMAQTNQPKATPQPQQAQQQPPRPNWVVNCSQGQQGLECRAGQSLFFKQTGQRFMSVAVVVAADTKKPQLLLQLPLGVYLPAGVSLRIGKGEAKTLPYESCDQAGCVAEYAVTDAELSAMAKGANLTVSAANRQKKSFNIEVSSDGFAAAYAKIK